MYKNRAEDGLNNICGKWIKEIREGLPKKTFKKKLSDMLQIEGLNLDKNAIRRIEGRQRFVTDIELKMIARVLNTGYKMLLE